MEKLPLEIIVYIFQYLSKEEQIKVSKVNKTFREAIFAPSLWPENGESMTIPSRQVTSFTKFLEQASNIKHLNVLFYGSVKPMPFRSIRHSVNLETVFKPLDYLQCLTLSFDICRGDMIYLPRSLKHLSLRDHGPCEKEPFINEDLLKSIADLCPQLEHFQIKSVDHCGRPLYSNKGLTYLLKKVNKTLRTLILLKDLGVHCVSTFSYFEFPPSSNLTTLCAEIDIHNYDESCKYLKLLIFENIQILSIRLEAYFNNWKNPFDAISTNCSLNNLRFLALSGFTICNDFYAALSKVPNLQVLYMHSCIPEIEPLVKYLRGCDSLKVFAWFSKVGYTENGVPALEKLKKETSLKIYLSFSCDFGERLPYHPYYYYPSSPNEYFDRIKSFKYLLNNIFFEKSHYFSNCHSPFLKNIKAFLGL